jgi:hypothetical protein
MDLLDANQGKWLMKPTTDIFEAELRAAFSNDEQRRWLTDVVNRLSGRPVSKCQEVKYWNHPELQEHLRVEGYSCCYQTSDRAGYPLYVMLSRSHTVEPIALAQIIDELSSDEIVHPFEKFGDYYVERSRSRGPGKYATIRFGSRWYMVSVCGQFKPHFRLVEARRPTALIAPMTNQEFLYKLRAMQAKQTFE